MNLLVKNGLHIRTKSGNDCCNNECLNKDAKSKFLNILAELLCEGLRINWKDKEMFKSLLITILESDLTDRDGLLEQYLHTQLDIIAEQFKKEFNIDSKVNYDYTIHAKFNDIIKAIKEKFDNNKQQTKQKK